MDDVFVLLGLDFTFLHHVYGKLNVLIFLEFICHKEPDVDPMLAKPL